MKVLVPTDYSDITIEHYKRLQDQWDKTENALERMLACISVLCDIPLHQVRQLPGEDIETLGKKLVWILDGQSRKHTLVPRFNMDGVEYGFVPDWSELTAGEFIDLEAYGSKGYYENLEGVMSIMYRRIVASTGDFYQIEPYKPTERKKKAMLECPMNVPMGAMGFFLTIGKQLASDTLNSFREADQAAHWLKSGVGIKRYTTSLMGMFSKSKA
jgi:hypothetical protein